MKNSSLVSIITTVFNNKNTVESAIKSVLSQDYPNIEYIITDGGSTDGTIEIINKYEDKIAKFVSEKDRGVYDGMNKGIKLATGDIIGILNSDDLYASNDVIGKIVSAFLSYSVDSVYGDLVYVDKNDLNKIIRVWKSGTFKYEKLKFGWMPPHPTLFVKRWVYEKYGFFNLDFPISADYDLMLRFLGKYKISTAYLPEILVKMRTGGKSKNSLKNLYYKSLEDYRIIKNNNAGNIITLIFKKLSKLPQFLKK